MNIDPIKEGSIVKLSNPGADEKDAKFVVTEFKGDRLDIQLLNSGMNFPPIETVSIKDVVLA